MKTRNLVLGCMLVLVIALVFAILGVVTVSSYKVENVAFATNPYATYNDIYITVATTNNIYTRSISEFDMFSLTGHLDYNTSTGTLTINDWDGGMKGITNISVRGNEPKDITIDFKCSPTFVLNEVEYGVEYSNYTPGGNLTLTSTEARTVNIAVHIIRSGGELTFKGNLSAKVTGSDYTFMNPETQKFDSANNNFALKILENSSYSSINPFPAHPTNDQWFDAYKDKRSLFQNVEFTINTTGKVEIGFKQGATVGRVGKQRIMRNCPISFVKCDGGFYLYHEDSDIEYSYSLPDNTIDKSFWNAYSTNAIAGYSCGGKYLEPLNQDYFKDNYRIIIAITKVVSKVKNITFNANGGSGSMSATVTDNDGNYTLPENEFTPPDDYTFAGWLVNSGSGDLAYKKGEELFFDSDVVLYPKWIETIHDFYEVGYADGVTNVVSYVVQEGTHFELMSYDDTGLTMPLGKHFAGWTDWYNGKTIYEEGYEYTMPDENLVFVATYDDNPGEVPVTITYDKNGGTGDYGPFEILDGEEYELPLNMFGEPANQDFKCWNINGTNYNPGDVITISGNTFVNAVWFTKDSLYANYDGTVRLGEQLIIDNLTVAFYYEDGSMVDIYPLVDVDYYLGVQNIDNILLYDFDEGGAIDITIKYKKDESFSTIMRVYVKILVSFDSNGGSGAMSSTEQWGDYNLPANGFTAPANKQFKGWSLTSNGDVISTAAINVSEDTTLYAIWEDIPEETYTVSFNANGGTGTMNPVQYAGTYTLPANGFTAPQGKQFKGWAYTSDGNVIAAATINVTEATTLYAIWDDIPVDPSTIIEDTITEQQASAGYNTTAFADAKAAGKTVKITIGTASISFDSAAVNAIGSTANTTIAMTISDNVAELNIPGAQKVIEITLNGFTAGNATVVVPFTTAVPQGKIAKVYFVYGNSKMDMNATFDGTKATFTVPHFSKYVIVFDDIPASQPENPDEPAVQPKKGLSGGAIAGIVIAIIVALGAAGFCVYWFVFRKKKGDSPKIEEKKEDNTQKEDVKEEQPEETPEEEKKDEE